MRTRATVACVVLACLLAGSACATHKQIRSNALEFLYPAGAAAEPAADVTLKLPVRVGLAFAPSSTPREDTFTETQKQDLLSRVEAAFEGREGIAGVEVIPSNYLQPGGSFANLEKVAAAFGVDLMALVSYDQFQFSETGRSSWAYWTLVGAYLVKGEKNETQTMLDAVVYDIPSRAMLLHATGKSGLTGKSTPIDVGARLRKDSQEGFAKAMDDLTVNLDAALKGFLAQAAAGRVRGPGTPAIAMQDASGRPVSPGGSGALGAAEVVAALLALAAGAFCRLRQRRA